MTPTKLQKFILFVNDMTFDQYIECFGSRVGIRLFSYYYRNVGKFISSLDSVHLNCLFEYVNQKLTEKDKEL